MILLVEDNADHEMLTIRALRKNQIANEIHVARDGQEALDFLYAKGQYSNRAASQLPSLVLLDLKLPKIDGLEVLSEMRKVETTKLVPVVVLTSSDEETDIVRSYQLGANSYVRKPVDFPQFMEATRQLGLYWLVINQGPPVK